MREIIDRLKKVSEGRFATLRFLESYARTPDIMGFLSDHWDEFIDRADAVDNIVKKFDVSVEDADEHVDAASEVYGRIEPTPVYASKQRKGKRKGLLERLQQVKIDEADLINEINWKNFAVGALLGVSLLAPGFITKGAEGSLKWSVAISRYEQDENILAKVIAGEAAGEGRKGMQAVANVIRNRAKSRNKTPKEIVLQPYQFSVLVEPKIMDRNYKSVKKIADELASNIDNLPDIVSGAENYVAQWLYDKIKADSEWTKKNDLEWVNKLNVVETIGEHVFLK